MRLFAGFAAVLAVAVVPFHGEVEIVLLGLICALGVTLHRGRPARI